MSDPAKSHLPPSVSSSLAENAERIVTFRDVFRETFSGLRVLLSYVALLAVLWAICYRLILGFTPLWLDIATILAGALGLLVLVVLGLTKPEGTNHGQK
jgi:RsiW-degrading membrane proteinase PrsW (M82 family)